MYVREGFTMAEMLIVIALMCVFSSIVMMSGSEAITTAKTGNIIDSLQNISMAAMIFYSNSADHFGRTPNSPADLKSHIAKYLNPKGNESKTDGYYVVNDSGTWWAGYKVENAQHERIEEKLTGHAKSVGLKGTDSELCPKEPYDDYEDHPFVWMMIRSNTK